MKTIQKYPSLSYPYLAVWTGGSSELEKSKYEVKEIFLISILQENQGEDLKPYVQSVTGGKIGYFTKNEDEYTPLPNGYEITLVQSEED